MRVRRVSVSWRRLLFVMAAGWLLAGQLLEAQEAQPAATPLTFAEFLEPGPELKLSARLLSASGRRVRLAGFMAASETPQESAFYLCPRPTTLDEEGAGTADLPPESVRVTLPPSVPVRFQPGRIEVTGLLEVGYREERDGEVSWIRLSADAPPSKKEK